MKQSTTSNLCASATEEELLVAEILLHLPNIISQSESQPSSQFSELTWSRKRRRSSLQLGAPDSRAPSPLVLKLEEDEFEEIRPQVKHQDNGGAATTATPDTPLDFPSSESDEKSTKHSLKKRSIKRSKKQYNERIKELTQIREVLRREIGNVRKYLNKLKDLNSKYKGRKEEVLKTRQTKEQSQKETYQSGMQSTQKARQIRTVSHQQPLIENLTAQNYPYSLSPIAAQMYLSNNGLRWVNRVGPVDLPDLNVSVEEAVGPSQPLDVERDRRAIFAHARRRRKGLMKKIWY